MTKCEAPALSGKDADVDRHCLGPWVSPVHLGAFFICAMIVSWRFEPFSVSTTSSTKQYVSSSRKRTAAACLSSDLQHLLCS